MRTLLQSRDIFSIGRANGFFGLAVLALGLVLSFGSCTKDKSVTPDSDSSPAVDLLRLVSIDPSQVIYSDTNSAVTFRATFNRDVTIGQVSFSILPRLPKKILIRPDAVLLVVLERMERFLVYEQHLQISVIDSLGATLTIDTTWNFRVVSGDTIPPRVVEVSPSGASQDANYSLHSEVVFSEPIVAGSVSFEFTPPVDGNVTITDSSIVFSPRVGFFGGVDYIAHLRARVDDAVNNRAVIDTSWTFSVSMDSVIYVISAGNGNGSIESPFGSIQLALDFVAGNPSFRKIHVASGIYSGSVVIPVGVEIIGGFDAQTWASLSGAKTVFQGGQIEGAEIGLLIKGVSSPVTLVNLSIEGSDAVAPGASSYGLYCLNSAAVTLRFVEISSGNGAAGESGTVFNKARGGWGGQGGYDAGSWYLDTATGESYWQSYILPGQSGAPGFCTDGLKNGGLENGGDGPAGIHYIPPLGMITALVEDNLDFYMNLPVRSGCGGGGGRGGSSVIIGHAGAGPPGGWGGTGGFGGQAGGSSVAIFSVQTTIAISNSTVIPKGGARGGNGTDQTDGVCSISCNGQPGGHGGGGAGGASIGILTYSSGTNFGYNVSIYQGAFGAGGSSNGNSGADGRYIRILSVQ